MLTSDPVPVVMLGASIAWVSLVTVEFYERIYRQRIAENSDRLRNLGQDQLKKLAADLDIQVKDVKEPIDARGIEHRLKEIRLLMNAQDMLVMNRERIFWLLGVSALSSILASIAPNFGIDTTWIAVVAYVVVGLVFVYGLYFLWQMFWFDKEILYISRIQVLMNWLCEKCRFPMELQSSHTVGKWLCRNCGASIDRPIVMFQKST